MDEQQQRYAAGNNTTNIPDDYLIPLVEDPLPVAKLNDGGVEIPIK